MTWIGYSDIDKVGALVQDALVRDDLSERARRSLDALERRVLEIVGTRMDAMVFVDRTATLRSHAVIAGREVPGLRDAMQAALPGSRRDNLDRA